MVSPPSKRAAVRHLKDRQGYSERRACKLVGTARSTARYAAKGRKEDARLRKEICALAGRHKRYGYRRIWAVLKRKGWGVNLKRVHRIWKEEGLGLAKKRPKRRRQAKGEVLRKAERKDQVWSWDFMEDRTERGGRLKMLNVVDEYTRECLTIRVERRLGSREVLETLEWLFQERGVPEFIRSDNGPEFVAQTVQDGLKKKGSQALYIQPGSPWENAYIESFNGKFRDECLNREVFRNGKEAQEVVELWRREYNQERPHSALGYQTPAEFARGCGRSVRPTASLHGHSRPAGQTVFLSL